MHSHQLYKNSSSSTVLPKLSVVSLFSALAILIGLYLYLIVILICISLMTTDINYCFMGLFAISIPLLVKYMFKRFALFFGGGVIYFLLLSFEIWDTSLSSDT